jgi:hypothetical protein
MQIVLNKEKGFKITAIQPQHYALLWWHVCNYKTKGKSLKGQTFSDLFNVSSGCPLSFNTTTTKSEEISTLYRCL